MKTKIKNTDFEEWKTIGHSIGGGGQGLVFKVKKRNESNEYALKSILLHEKDKYLEKRKK